MIFQKDIEVSYKDIIGIISFVCDDYITVLVRRGEHSVQDVKILIYRQQFDEVVCTDNK